VEPEERQGLCWYGRRTPDLPLDIGLQTIVDGQLLYCAHPMWFPVVGHRFDVRNCGHCELFKAVKTTPSPASRKA
jgi:hypothetical protein